MVVVVFKGMMLLVFKVSSVIEGVMGVVVYEIFFDVIDVCF